MFSFCWCLFRCDLISDKWFFGHSGHDPSLTNKLQISLHFSCQTQGARGRVRESLSFEMILLSSQMLQFLHLNSLSLVAGEGNAPSQLENSVTWASKDRNLKVKIIICMLILETSELISSQTRNSYKKSDYSGKPLLRKYTDEWFLEHVSANIILRKCDVTVESNCFAKNW